MSRRFGIAGGMGSGKSTLAAQLARPGLCRVVEVDDLRRRALWASRARRHVAMRERLAAAMGLATSGPDGLLDRAALAARAFSGRDAIEAYAAATAPTLREDASEACAAEGPPTAIVWARLVEDGYADLLDGPIGVVACPPDAAAARIARQAAAAGDPLPAEEAVRRVALLATDADRLALARATGLHVVRIDSVPNFDPAALGEFLVGFTDIEP